MSRSRLVMGAATLAAATAVVVALHRRRPSSRVRRLIAASKSLHRQKDYERSSTVALEALELAREHAPDSPVHLTAQMHVAAMHAAQEAPAEALAALDEALELGRCLHGADSLELVPVLHARAEVIEAAGQPIASAAAELARARELRRRHCGENSLESANGSYNLASLLVRGSWNAIAEGDGEAAYAVELLERATSLTLEACSVALLTLDDAGQAEDYVANILEELPDDDGGAGGAVAAAIETARSKLRDAYLEATGEEWEAGESGGRNVD